MSACLLTIKETIVGGIYFGGRDDFILGNNELKVPARHLRLHELIYQMQF